MSADLPSLWASPRVMGQSVLSRELSTVSSLMGIRVRVAPTSPSGAVLGLLDAGELVPSASRVGEIELWVSSEIAFEDGFDADAILLRDVDTSLLRAVVGHEQRRASKWRGGGLLVPLQRSSRIRTLAFFSALSSSFAANGSVGESKATLVRWWSQAMKAVRDGVDMLSVAPGLPQQTVGGMSVADLRAEDALRELARGDDGLARAWTGLAEKVLVASEEVLTDFLSQS